MAKPDGGIIWLASYPKSGSTWLRMFLASYINDGHQINPSSIPRELTYTDNSPQDYHMVSPYPIEHLGPAEVALIRGAVLVKILADSNKRPVIVKTHNANAMAEGCRLIPSSITAGVIYVVRDPRDVAVSFSNWTNNSIDKTIELMGDDRTTMPSDGPRARTLCGYIGSWSKHVGSWLDQFDPLVIKYERMHEAPTEAFTKVLLALDRELDAKRLARAIESTMFSKMQELEEVSGFAECPPQVDRFFRVGKVGQWKDCLTKEQSDRVVADHGDMMVRLGYDTS